MFLFGLPALVCLLPWPLGFALLKRVARMPSVFADVVEGAWAQASQTLPALDRSHFCRRHRLLLLIDRCDSSLCLLRSHRWWRRHVEVLGDPLENMQAGLFLSMHWGCGGWIWRYLDACGVPAHVLGRRAEVTDVGRSWLSRAYLSWRTWAAMRSGCRGFIEPGGSAERIRAAFAADEMVLGMVDMVPKPEQRSAAVTLLGRATHFPTGLVAVAVRAGAPITVASMGVDMDSGRRQLFLEILPEGLEVEDAMRRYAAHLQQRVETRPAQWQAWHYAAAYFARGDD